MAVSTRSKKKGNVDSDATSYSYDDSRRKRTKKSPSKTKHKKRSHCTTTITSPSRSLLQSAVKATNDNHNKDDSRDRPFGILHQSLLFENETEDKELNNTNRDNLNLSTNENESVDHNVQDETNNDDHLNLLMFDDESDESIKDTSKTKNINVDLFDSTDDEKDSITTSVFRRFKKVWKRTTSFRSDETDAGNTPKSNSDTSEKISSSGRDETSLHSLYNDNSDSSSLGYNPKKRNKRRNKIRNIIPKRTLMLRSDEKESAGKPNSNSDTSDNSICSNNNRKDEASIGSVPNDNSDHSDIDDTHTNNNVQTQDDPPCEDYYSVNSFDNNNEKELSLNENDDDDSFASIHDNHLHDNNNVSEFEFPPNAIIIPKQHNKKMEGNNSTSDSKQLYSKIVSHKASVEYYHSTNKNKFIVDFIEEHFEGYQVFKFDKKENKYITLSEEDLNKTIYKRFITLKATYKRSRKTAKKYQNQEQIEDDPYETTNPMPSEVATYKSKERDRSYDHFYEKGDSLPGFKHWHFYSMFHSVYQSFSTVVYNYSHRLNDKCTVHRSTRVKLLFPENANCTLVIHGRLVHSGSASKLETSNSYNTSHDLRLFAYLSTLKTRQERNELYKNHLPSDTVDVCTFKMCKKDCPKCRLVNDNGLIGIYENDSIDIAKCLNELKCTKNTKRKQMNPVKVVGDIENLGWAVYTGIDFSLTNYQTLKSQFREAVLGKGKDSWVGINSTMRKVLKIDKLLGEGNRLIQNDLPLLTQVFDDILNKVLKKENVLGNEIQMDGRAVLANFAHLDEQQPHRDFSSVQRKRSRKRKRRT